jgi:CheY-like chemotaxis protein
MPEPSRHAGRVLIVDDDTILASLYRIKLQAAGFVVDVAETGEAGLLQIAQRQPDIVVLDLMLADMNGVDALRVLRQNPVTQRLPVIVFSSAFLGGLVEEAERVGATKCLNKGNTPPNRLIDEIRIILEPESVKGLSGVSAPVLA